MQNGQMFELQFRLRRHDGTYRWMLGRAAPERDEGGRVLRWIGTGTDIDDAKRSEEELRQAQRDLERANAAKDDFLAAASHELRTPLQAAKGHAHLTLLKLGADQADSPVGKGVKVVMRQIDRMTQLVENLLDVSRIQAGRLSLELEGFNLSALLHDVCDRTGGLSSKHPIVLHAADGLEITADRSRVEQVITNLLSNAVRYSPEGGKVEVTADREEGGIHLVVRDSGVGIPVEKQQVIFERFARAHGARYGGLGLGLTITQGIVEQHGGRIWVESEGEGKGATFHVVLPSAPTGPAEQQHASPAVS
jgi:signal transduction histidine kinase